MPFNSHTAKCACGCGKTDAINNMVQCRYRTREGSTTKPLGRSWMVRQECRAEFESELGYRVRQAVLFRTTRDCRFVTRLSMAAECWQLEYAIVRRLNGEKAAKRAAWRSVWSLLRPHWLSKHEPQKTLAEIINEAPSYVHSR